VIGKPNQRREKKKEEEKKMGGRIPGKLYRIKTPKKTESERNGFGEKLHSKGRVQVGGYPEKKK